MTFAEETNIILIFSYYINTSHVEKEQNYNKFKIYKAHTLFGISGTQDDRSVNIIKIAHSITIDVL